MSKKIGVYQIDNGVPLPTEALSDPIPLDQLAVDESILFPLTDRNRVQTLASVLKARKGKVFTVKKQDQTNARVWRIK